MGKKDFHNKPTNINSILIINLAGVGDILLSTPALRALRNLYPKQEISMLVSSKGAEMAEGLTYIDKVFSLQIRDGTIFPLAKILDNFMLLFALRKKQFDLVINMRTLVSKISAMKMKLLIDIIKPKISAGRDTEKRGNFFDIRIAETIDGQRHETAYDIDTIEALGGDVTNRLIDFEIDKRSEENVDRILERGGVSKGDILIGIHPGGQPSHRWPIDNFSKVVDAVGKKIFCKFVVTGWEGEKNLADSFEKITNNRIINLAGMLNLKELGALIKRCNLYLSNDTGPMHIAAILETPLIAIFGPGDITRFDPRNISKKAVVLRKGVECSPCQRRRCKDLRCLRLIFPREVVALVWQQIKSFLQNS